jgi:hypothetical protein
MCGGPVLTIFALAMLTSENSQTFTSNKTQTCPCDQTARYLTEPMDLLCWP